MARAVVAMFLDPTNIYKGIVIKVPVTIALVKANKDARKYEEARRTMGNHLL